MDLHDSQKIEIEKIVNDLFKKLKFRLLGRFFTGPRIFFEVEDSISPLDTLEGIYNYTFAMMYGPGTKPKVKRVRELSKITGNYIEAERLKSINRIMVSMEQANDFSEVKESLSEEIGRATSHIETIITTETRNIQAHAEKEGIERLGASIGVLDPTVCKLGVVDSKLCKTCKKLWHLSEDNLHIPKVYKMSELQNGYTKHKNPVPTHNASHPRCRHLLSMIPPNFGFNDKGMIEYKGRGYDVYQDQRNS